VRVAGAATASSLKATRFPWVTALFVGAALAVQVLPGVAPALEYRRSAVAAGEWWRPVTSQFVHWSWPMAGVDLGVCLLAGALVECRSRRRLAGVLAAAALAVAATIHLLAPAIERYRGASGIAIALAVSAALGFIAAGRRPVRALAGGILLLLAAKLAIEASTGEALMAWTLPEGIRLASAAHMAGAVAALVVALAVAHSDASLPRR